MPAPTASDVTDTVSSRATLAVTVIFLLNVISYADRNIVSLLVEQIKGDLQITDFEVSLLQGIAFAGLYALFGLPLGWAVDRFQRRWVIFGGVFVWSIAATACGLARTFGQLALARCFVGIGEASLSPAGFSMLSDLVSRKRLTSALAIVSVGAVVGQAAAFGVGGWAVGFAEDRGGVVLPLLGPVEAWQFAFLVVGLPGLLCAPLILLLPEPPRRTGLIKTAEPPTIAQTANHIVRHGRFYFAHFLGFSAIYVIAAGSAAWLPAFMMRTYGWGAKDVGFSLFMIVMVSGTVGQLGGGRIVDALVERGYRDGHLRFYAWAAVALTVFGVAAFQAPTATLFIVLICIAKCFFQLAGVAGSAIQLATPNRMRGKATATYLVFTTVFGVIGGPMIVAGFTDFLFGDPAMVGSSLTLLIAIFAPLAATCFFVGQRGMRRAMEELEESSTPSSGAIATGSLGPSSN